MQSAAIYAAAEECQARLVLAEVSQFWVALHLKLFQKEDRMEKILDGVLSCCCVLLLT